MSFDLPEPLFDPHEIQANLERRIFYHGTSKRSARRILAHGLRDYSWTDETPFLKYKAGQGIARWMHDGSYGRGTYITCNWRTALYFGPVLFRLEVQAGTRLVQLDVPPDPGVLTRLRRKFGHEILKTTPRKVMPTNKRLTLDEAIQLARHHCAMHQSVGGWGSPRQARHEDLMFDLRSLLVRYGIHGWGEATDLGGIVVFATDRLKVAGMVLSLPTRELAEEARQHPQSFRNHATLDSLISMTRYVRNPGAANTHAWVEASNFILREKL